MSESVPNFYQLEERERDSMPAFAVTEISPGLEFGHGTISSEQAHPELKQQVKDTVHQDPAILVAVDAHDDGCGDGRGVKRVYNSEREFSQSLHRSKILGGGMTMATAARIANGETWGKDLNEDFAHSADVLTAKGVDFGAHTDELASGEQSGCGAIDKAPEVILAAVRYKDEISSVVTALGLDQETVQEAYENFENYASKIPEQPGFSGKQAVDKVLASKKVVKELKEDHRELRIVLNKVRAYTVDQGLIRERTDEAAQVFAVDVWRLEDIVADLYDEETQKSKTAFAGTLIYTLATTGVLTSGDLPVDMIEEQ
ncbi:hypothetical protein KC963_04255 [Candidatus Saccharibacteria bacterium]|nr:hypothetical protein [Candidatus Saccharibacteria bacterium]